MCAKAYGREENRIIWLRYRLDVFNKTIRVSLERQIVKPKAVYVFFDEGDREFWKNEVELSSIFVPVFSINNHLDIVEKLVSESYAGNVAFSRIDSDDLISDDYFEEINRSITEAVDAGLECRCVVVPRGYRTDGSRIQDWYANSSPFLTEFMPDLRRVRLLRMSHRKVLDEQRVINNEARFMQLIHKNIINRFSPQNLTRNEYECRISQHESGELMLGTRIVRLMPSRYQRFDLRGVLKRGNVFGWIDWYFRCRRNG